MAREAAEDGLSPWTFATQMIDLDEVLGSQLGAGPALTIAAIWEMNWQMEDILFLLSASVILTFKSISVLKVSWKNNIKS